MGLFRARVENGRLVVNEPTALPDGTVLDLVVDDEGDDLSDAQREALHEALGRSLSSLDNGRTRPSSRIIQDLRARE